MSRERKRSGRARRLAQLAGIVSLAALAYRLTRPGAPAAPAPAAPAPPAPEVAVPDPLAPAPVAPGPDAPGSAAPPRRSVDVPAPGAPRVAATTAAPAIRSQSSSARREDDRHAFWRRPRTAIIAVVVVVLTAVVAGGSVLIADAGPASAPAPASGESDPDPATTTPAAEPLAKIGVYVGPGQRRSFEQFAKWLGRRPMIVSDGLEELRWEAIVDPWWLIDAWDDRSIGLAYSLVMLPREQPATLQEGAAGEYDHYYRELAERLVAGGQGSAILRPGWEFNGDWQPWAARQDPQAFVAYFRRIVDAMRSVPGADFTFVWNPGIGPNDPNPWPAERAWPGDAYVDAIGVDAYDVCFIPGTYPIPADADGDEAHARRQRCWDELLNGKHGLEWYAAFAKRKGKPLVVPEYALVPRGYPGGGDNPIFIQGMHDWAARHGVKWMIYFNKADADMGNHRIDDGTYPWSQRLFKQLYGAPAADGGTATDGTSTTGGGA